jgi:hypothetical protein
MSSWCRREASGDVLLDLHVQPGARKTEIAGVHGDALKVRLAAPPVDGRANDCLIDFIAARTGVPRAAVELVSGATSRRKRLRIRGASQEAVARLV